MGAFLVMAAAWLGLFALEGDAVKASLMVGPVVGGGFLFFALGFSVLVWLTDGANALARWIEAPRTNARPR